MSEKKRGTKSLAVFISGQGSNLSVFLQRQEAFKSLFVISSSDKAFGLKKAERFAVETHILPPKIHWNSLHKDLLHKKIDLIFLAGFMKIIPAEFVSLWKDKIFNLHPSLLPSYKGLNSIERAYNDKAPMGASIHRVTPEVDEGEVLFQEQSVSTEEITSLSLEKAELYTHICEQKLVNSWIEKFS